MARVPKVLRVQKVPKAKLLKKKKKLELKGYSSFDPIQARRREKLEKLVCTSFCFAPQQAQVQGQAQGREEEHEVCKEVWV